MAVIACFASIEVGKFDTCFFTLAYVACLVRRVNACTRAQAFTSLACSSIRLAYLLS